MFIIPAFHLAVRAILLPEEDSYIHSPLDVARDAYHGLRAHCERVRKEQEQFQQYIQALGIERVSRLKTADVIDGFCPR